MGKIWLSSFLFFLLGKCTRLLLLVRWSDLNFLNDSHIFFGSIKRENVSVITVIVETVCQDRVLLVTALNIQTGIVSHTHWSSGFLKAL